MSFQSMMTSVGDKSRYLYNEIQWAKLKWQKNDPVCMRDQMGSNS